MEEEQDSKWLFKLLLFLSILGIFILFSSLVFSALLEKNNVRDAVINSFILECKQNQTKQDCSQSAVLSQTVDGKPLSEQINAHINKRYEEKLGTEGGEILFFLKLLSNLEILGIAFLLIGIIFLIINAQSFSQTLINIIKITKLSSLLIIILGIVILIFSYTPLNLIFKGILGNIQGLEGFDTKIIVSESLKKIFSPITTISIFCLVIFIITTLILILTTKKDGRRKEKPKVSTTSGDNSKKV